MGSLGGSLFAAFRQLKQLPRDRRQQRGQDRVGLLLVAMARGSAHAFGEAALGAVMVELAERPDSERVELSGCQGHGLTLLPASGFAFTFFEEISVLPLVPLHSQREAFLESDSHLPHPMGRWVAQTCHSISPKLHRPIRKSGLGDLVADVVLGIRRGDRQQQLAAYSCEVPIAGCGFGNIDVVHRDHCFLPFLPLVGAVTRISAKIAAAS